MKNYNGYMYINPLNEETMVIDWKNSVKLPVINEKIFVAVKSTEKYNAVQQAAKSSTTLPTNVHDWMKLMEKSER